MDRETPDEVPVAENKRVSHPIEVLGLAATHPVWGYPCLACRGFPLSFLQGAVVSLRVVQAHLGESLAAGVVVRDQCLADGQPEAPGCGG